ncbi:CDP-glycerol glycerophosphotransferase family protein [Corynebacterium renale]|uniref:CDP-glycerol glycerophosphotransferase family protein n=1 Tax=Corynebacterium renale TaxID=1724 RepID=UPI000E1BD2D5|nr:CDP-glycerol glycerophosphotransferase family protein [Corynebacterium renale]
MVLPSKRGYERLHKKSVLEKSGVKLDPNLKYAEDGKFMTQIIMRKRKFGVVAEAQLNYRKRNLRDSALDTSVSTKDYYLPVLEHFSKFLFEEFRDKKGKIPRYVQQVVCYDLQWRVRQRSQDVLTPEELAQYKQGIADLAQDLDTDVILKQRNIYIDHKLLLLSLQRGKPALPDLQIRWHSVFLDGEKVWGAPAQAFGCVLHMVRQEGNKLRIKGSFKGLPIDQFQFGFLTNHAFVRVRRIPAPMKKRTVFLGEEVFHPFYFEIDLEVTKDFRIRPAVEYGGKIYRSKLIFSPNSGFVSAANSYKLLRSFIVQNVKGKYLAVKPRTTKEILRRELSLQRTLAKNKQLKGIKRRKATLLLYRLLGIFATLVKRKQVWLISDRVSSAGDNGEAFFRYMASRDDQDKTVVFLQKKGSRQYNELRKVGRVVDPNSFTGRMLYLIADVFASSQADEYILNPFGKDARIIRDNYRFDFVFLQHGVTVNDISGWLNTFEKPISRFVVCGKMEYDALTQGNYGLNPSEVPTLGFPRHDRLVDNKNTRRIVVAPTWRAQLAGVFNSETKIREYRDDFKESDYFRFYQALILSEELNQALEREGYVLDFVLHPNFAQQHVDFERTPRVNILTPPYDYKSIISNSEIFITDFSSVVADAAFLRKKIGYIHFDDLLEAGKHTVEKGPFDIVENGFGPVFYSLDSLVDFLIQGMTDKQDSSIDYEARIQYVFAHRDNKNSMRVYEEIEALCP